MEDRVYPAAKPNPPPAAAANGGGAPASFPAPKPQMYQRPIYRPQAPAKRRRGRSCRCSFCCCFCWALLAVILLAVLAAVAGGAFYLLYRPHRPSFTVSSVRLTAINLTDSATAPVLTDSITLTVTAKNPNKKIVYLYDDFSLSAATAANGVPLGDATVPGFTHQAGNTTVFTATIAANGVTVDPSGASSDIKKSSGFNVVLDGETRAGVRVGSLKTKKIGIQVHCEGIKVTPPPPPPPAPKKVKGKNSTVLAPAPAPSVADTTTATVSTAAHSCKVRVRVKIWKWTF
ncbi:NDR1/HIN1-like protein 13 [Phragmites australis]|uniref:NDR1/HIN1-like protein 13 n=1 Tax=Phragmites australis TaxID=29695 RepID=UPI002D76605C|nr:NDR1/HIN1-like protein 13 [Phragmites australis]